VCTKGDSVGLILSNQRRLLLSRQMMYLTQTTTLSLLPLLLPPLIIPDADLAIDSGLTLGTKLPMDGETTRPSP